MLNKIFSLLSGLIFGLGLTLSSMTNPSKVINFLEKSREQERRDTRISLMDKDATNFVNDAVVDPWNSENSRSSGSFAVCW